jgi:hypothetical protein
LIEALAFGVPTGIQSRRPTVGRDGRPERLVRRLKGFRRIFSRFEKPGVMFAGLISFALAVDLLRLC